MPGGVGWLNGPRGLAIRLVKERLKVAADEIIEGDALPVISDDRIMRARKRLSTFTKSLCVLIHRCASSRGSPCDGLDQRQQVL